MYILPLLWLQIVVGARPSILPVYNLPEYACEDVFAVSSPVLQTLRAVCATWTGAVTATIYLRVINDTIVYESTTYRLKDDAVKAVEDLHNVLKEHCKLDILVVLEDMPNDRKDFWNNVFFGYPVNAMRNIALDAATTDMVLLLDGDFVVGPAGAHELLQEQYMDLTHIQHKQGLIVLPAFKASDTWGVDQSVELLTWLSTVPDKAALVAAWDNGSILAFDQRFHDSTDYARWRHATRLYQAHYSMSEIRKEFPGQYEPYVLARRAMLPKYDERFRGYHGNKLSYLWYLAKLGFSFHVHPQVVVMHLPHPLVQEAADMAETEKMRVLRHIWHVHMREQAANGTLRPIAQNHVGVPAHRLWCHAA